MKREGFEPDLNTSERSLEELAIALAEMDPKPISHFTPDNLSDVKERFLHGDASAIQDASYRKLDTLDFDHNLALYTDIMQEISNHPAISQNHLHVYQEYVQRNVDINELMRQSVLFRTARTEAEKILARQTFIEINKKLYGEPQVEAAAAMVQEVFADTAGIGDPVIRQVKSEFEAMLPEELVNSEYSPNALKPSEETKEFLDDFVDYIYGSLLARTDEFLEGEQFGENPKIDAENIAEAFRHVIDYEFPNSGWTVVLEEANTIKVEASQKKVIVPIDRKSVTANKLRGLVVHELGVHMLRSIIGEGSDLIPQRFGFAGAGESEEGLAKVVESTVVGGESRTGYQHYLTAFLLNQGYSFKEVFEVMWRYKVLDAYLDKPVEKIDSEYIDRQKSATFGFMFRSVRGTNELPWHITLNYFNGTHSILNYIEAHKEDPEMMTLLYLGKIDPTKSNHIRGALDAHARYT